MSKKLGHHPPSLSGSGSAHESESSHEKVDQNSQLIEKASLGEQTKLSAAASIILKFLTQGPKSHSEKHLMRSVRGRKQHKVSALRTLVKDGKVTRSGSGKKGDCYRYALAHPPLNSDEILQPAREEVLGTLQMGLWSDKRRHSK
jgi:hypothetical protein